MPSSVSEPAKTLVQNKQDHMHLLTVCLWTYLDIEAKVTNMRIIKWTALFPTHISVFAAVFWYDLLKKQTNKQKTKVSLQGIARNQQ